MAIEIVLADDHPIVLDGLDQLFRLEDDLVVVARCRSGEEALQKLRELQPRVLILDLRMPGLGGFEVLQAIFAEKLPTRVVLLAAALDDEQLREAVRLGVAGVVLKEMAPEKVVEAVRAVAAGGQWIDRAMLHRALRSDRDIREAPAPAALTPRETEIVRMVASGLRNRAIAERLEIGEGTVKMHLHNIYEKLELDGRVALTLRAQKMGLV